MESGGVEDVLRDFGIEGVAARAGGLDVERDWVNLLGLSEQQLLVLCRLALARPEFAFLYRIDTTLRAAETIRALRALKAGQSPVSRSRTPIRFAMSTTACFAWTLGLLDDDVTNPKTPNAVSSMLLWIGGVFRRSEWAGHMPRLLLFLLTLVFGAAGNAASLSPVAKAEIDGLLSRLEASSCTFNRNGTWYPASEAKSHLLRKLKYLEDRGAVETAEQFIELAASSSSTTVDPISSNAGAAPLSRAGRGCCLSCGRCGLLEEHGACRRGEPGLPGSVAWQQVFAITALPTDQSVSALNAARVRTLAVCVQLRMRNRC